MQLELVLLRFAYMRLGSLVVAIASVALPSVARAELSTDLASAGGCDASGWSGHSVGAMIFVVVFFAYVLSRHHRR